MVGTLGLSAFLILAPLFAQASTTIAGGTEVPPGHAIARSVVILSIELENGKKGLCTGSILDQDIILTAAHCLATAKKTRILFGVNRNAPEVEIEAGRAYIPRDYFANKVPDFALLRFDGGLPPGYEPALVLPDAAKLKNGDPVVLAGYGVTAIKGRPGAGILRRVEQSVKGIAKKPYQIQITHRRGTGACPGDSGGPAYVPDERGYQLFGVASYVTYPYFADPCGLDSVYTDIHHPEIKSLMGAAIQALRSGSIN